MKLHLCPLDKSCRSFGTPWRAYLTTGRGTVFAVALRPRDRFVASTIEEVRQGILKSTWTYKA